MYTSPNEQLDVLLDSICEELQLPPSEHDRAEEHYKAVGGWLEAEGSQLRRWKPTIYPQGSFRIGTTVRPLQAEEFDLDLVCELQLGTAQVSPVAILDVVEQRLRDHGIYRDMISRKRRCVRLTYAHEFHLDILPARPESEVAGTRVRVPDRELLAWMPSDPKGYARWFEGRLAQIKLARVEPVPDQESADEKTSLQLAVQLLKRWRDITYKEQPDAAPRSIVLTTLAGECLTGATTTSAAVREFIDAILRRARSNPSQPIVVRNPAQPEEILSEQWQRDPTSFRLFVSRLEELGRAWSALESATNFETVDRLLSLLFGEGVTKEAFVREGARVEKHRAGGTLGVARATGGLSLGLGPRIVPVRPTTFYGDE